MKRVERLAEAYAAKVAPSEDDDYYRDIIEDAVKYGYAAAVAELRSEEANKFARHHHENTICIPHSDWADWLEREET